MDWQTFFFCFSYEYQRMGRLSKNILMFFFCCCNFYLNFLTLNFFLPYLEGVYHTRIIETFPNANARMVRMVHTMTMVTGICVWEWIREKRREREEKRRDTGDGDGDGDGERRFNLTDYYPSPSLSVCLSVCCLQHTKKAAAAEESSSQERDTGKHPLSLSLSLSLSCRFSVSMPHSIALLIFLHFLFLFLL